MQTLALISALATSFMGIVAAMKSSREARATSSKEARIASLMMVALALSASVLVLVFWVLLAGLMM